MKLEPSTSENVFHKKRLWHHQLNLSIMHSPFNCQKLCPALCQTGLLINLTWHL